MKNGLKQIVILAAFVAVTSVRANVLSKAQSGLALGLCRGYGLLGVQGTQMLNSIVPSIEEAAAATCCKIAEFQQDSTGLFDTKHHSHVAQQVLHCAPISEDQPIEVKDMCGFAQAAVDAVKLVPRTGNKTVDDLVDAAKSGVISAADKALQKAC